MRARLLQHLTYGNVVASLALFVALGGTGYAALALPRDSVGARELRPRSVGHRELARNAVRSDNVRNGSLMLDDFAATARRALTGKPGQAGSPGPAGVNGAKGDAGAPGKDAVALWAAIYRSGRPYLGNATAASEITSGVYRVSFARSVEGCGYLATLADIDGDPASPGRITVAADGNGGVRVNTFGINGLVESNGFHLLVVC
jgi:hypothetical protein